VLARGERLADRWAVVGQAMEVDGRLTTRRTWLWGERSDRPALVLDFAVQGRPFEAAILLGSCFEGECVFYPSSSQMRAIVDTRGESGQVMPSAEIGDASIAGALARAGSLVAENPWRRVAPMLLRGVLPVRGEGDAEGWALVDSDGASLPLASQFVSSQSGGVWRLLAASGARPACVFGEWDFGLSGGFRPLGAWAPGAVYCDLLARQALHGVGAA
jgi:hypothetical protein